MTFDKICNLPIGIKLDLAHLYAVYDVFCCSWARVEAVGADWAVLRHQYGDRLFLLEFSDIDRYGSSMLVEYPCGCEDCKREAERTE